MIDWIIYLFKSTLVFSWLYLPFLFMKRDTLYKLNRFYLISVVFLSAIIPLIKISAEVNPHNATGFNGMLQTITVIPQQTSQHLLQWSFMQWVSVLIVSVSILVLLARIFQTVKIFRLIKKHKIHNSNIIVLQGEHVCYSAWGYIFISPDMQQTTAMAHEAVHVKQKHTIDLVIFNLFTAMHWFNPFVWLALSNVKAQHEYEADKICINLTGNKNEYQALLLSSALGCDVQSLTHSFSSPTLKNRFIMMTKKQSSKWVSLKTLLVIPFLAIAVLAFSTQSTVLSSKKEGDEKQPAKKRTEKSTAATAAVKGNSATSTTITSAPVTDAEPTPNQLNTTAVTSISATNAISTTPDATATAMVDEMTQPEFPGGNDAFIKYMQNNIKYPENVTAEGKVYVQFMVKEDGSITDVTVKRGFNEACDKEAVRVIAGMPKWKPAMKAGKPAVATLTLPVHFRPEK